jgi:hypothetical protein
LRLVDRHAFYRISLSDWMQTPICLGLRLIVLESSQYSSE